MDIQLNQGEQDARITLSPTTSKGNPAELDGPAEFVVESGDIAVEPGEDGRSAIIRSGGVGQSTLRVRADADLGEGVRHIEVVVNVDVVAPQAEDLGINVEVIEKEQAPEAPENPDEEP
jgi:hypothetical protein